MVKVNYADHTWKELVESLLVDPEYRVAPREQKSSEILDVHYKVPMPAFLDIAARDVKLPFMFIEAAWILSGSNRLSWIKKYLPGYARFSDEGQFMRGAYGPMFLEQLPYIVEVIKNDNDTRQGVLTIWRPRPGKSKDVPCTVSAKFYLREGVLHSIFDMRSQDVILGLTYDIFTFSMMTEAVRLELQVQGVNSTLGNLSVTVGSLHLYDNYYDRAEQLVGTRVRDGNIQAEVETVLMNNVDSEDLMNSLIKGAQRNAKKSL